MVGVVDHAFLVLQQAQHTPNTTQPPPKKQTKTKQEDETRALRDSIAASAPSLNTSLAAWWNVYDAFNVWRNSGVGDQMPEITSDQFNQVQALGYWLELSKMRSSLAGNLLGGALLRDVADRLGSAAAAYERGSSVRAGCCVLLVLCTHALHHSTILSLKQHNNQPKNNQKRPTTR